MWYAFRELNKIQLEPTIYVRDLHLISILLLFIIALLVQLGCKIQYKVYFDI